MKQRLHPICKLITPLKNKNDTGSSESRLSDVVKRYEVIMKYNQKITLKDGREAWLRNCDFHDGAAVYDVFNATHAETDYLLTYPEENRFDPEQGTQYLKEKSESPNEIEIIAFVGDRVAGIAGIGAVGTKIKVRHRAEFGVSIMKEYWGLGLGKALANACIQCAKEAGYIQLELNAVSENTRAVSLYRYLGLLSNRAVTVVSMSER